MITAIETSEGNVAAVPLRAGKGTASARFLVGLCVYAAGVTGAHASLIVAPHSAGRDGDLAGIVVAAPDDGASASLINPAGVVSAARDQALLALMPGTVTVSYENPVSGYRGSGSKQFLALNLWLGLGEWHGWSFGAGAFGSMGAAFKLPADPSIGQTSPFLGEMGMLNFGVNAGRTLAPGLRVGFQLSPSYAMQKARSPSPMGDLDFEADGVGWSGALGLVYDASERLALGLAYRSRGVTELRGDARIGGMDDDVSITFVTPQSVSVGSALRWSKRLRLLAQLRWTDYAQFEDGDIEFKTASMMNMPVIADARSGVHWGIAAEYQVFPGSWLRGGFTVGKAMIEDSAVAPNMFDHDSKMAMLGYEIAYGRIMVGFTAGFVWLESRTIDPATNPYFPGHYDTQDTIFAGGARVTWNLRP